MIKILIFIIFVALAVVTAGVFGIVHDQISFSVSQEYFTKYKFVHFGLADWNAPDRLRASVVGVLATWWTGIPLGIVIGLAGFMHASAGQMRRALSWSLLLVAACTIAVSLAGLAFGCLAGGAALATEAAAIATRLGVQDVQSFLCVGYMHNAAYLGAIISIPLGLLFHVVYRRRSRATAP